MASSVAKPIGPHELRDLILPILACLPTAFLAPRPPPALLPLLSPILRQRIHLHTSAISQSTESPSSGTWLRLLTWSNDRAQNLADIVSRLQLEPHPVSGEIELFGDGTDQDAGRLWYRQLDEETLQARCDVKEYELGFTYVWCTNDTGGVGLENGLSEEPKDGWRVAELVPLDGEESLEDQGWQADIGAAERAGRDTFRGPVEPNIDPPSSNQLSTSANEEDDYWASYDRTPGKGTPAATRTASVGNAFGDQGESEQAYFARYAQVQPDADAGDTHGDISTRSGAVQSCDQISAYPENPDFTDFMKLNQAIEQPSDISTPTTQRRTLDITESNLSRPTESLRRSTSGTPAVAETSVKQHISTEIKSLFRLAHGVGIEREEFTDLVQRELDVLGLVDL